MKAMALLLMFTGILTGSPGAEAPANDGSSQVLASWPWSVEETPLFLETPATPSMDPEDPVCPYFSQRPCPTGNNCGYTWDGFCCIAQCPGFGCQSFCQT